MTKNEKKIIIEKAVEAWDKLYEAEQLSQCKARAVWNDFNNEAAQSEWNLASDAETIARHRYAIYADIIDDLSLYGEWREAFGKYHNKKFGF